MLHEFKTTITVMPGYILNDTGQYYAQVLVDNSPAYVGKIPHANSLLALLEGRRAAAEIMYVLETALEKIKSGDYRE